MRSLATKVASGPLKVFRFAFVLIVLVISVSAVTGRSLEVHVEFPNRLDIHLLEKGQRAPAGEFPEARRASHKITARANVQLRLQDRVDVEVYECHVTSR